VCVLFSFETSSGMTKASPGASTRSTNRTRHMKTPSTPLCRGATANSTVVFLLTTAVIHPMSWTSIRETIHRDSKCSKHAPDEAEGNHLEHMPKHDAPVTHRRHRRHHEPRHTVASPSSSRPSPSSRTASQGFLKANKKKRLSSSSERFTFGSRKQPFIPHISR